MDTVQIVYKAVEHDTQSLKWLKWIDEANSWTDEKFSVNE